jgi:hypothetical protein
LQELSEYFCSKPNEAKVEENSSSCYAKILFDEGSESSSIVNNTFYVIITITVIGGVVPLILQQQTSLYLLERILYLVYCTLWMVFLDVKQ